RGRAAVCARRPAGRRTRCCWSTPTATSSGCCRDHDRVGQWVTGRTVGHRSDSGSPVGQWVTGRAGRGSATVCLVSLPKLIEAADREFLLFAITPPRASTEPDRVRTIAAATLRRLETVRPDGLVLYDIADENDRNPDERPFPFL